MVSDYRNLLLGCGRSRRKQYCARPEHPRDWQGELVTLDINRHVAPDLWCDLNAAPPWTAIPCNPLYQDSDSICLDKRMGIGIEFKSQGLGVMNQIWTLQNDYWDEIHAYQVLEHLGTQGDAYALLSQFAEIWRLLKPNGYLVASVPSRFDQGLWGDPSHRRAIYPMTLAFLDQGEYARQIDQLGLSMSDFRHIYKADFRHVQSTDNKIEFVFVLQAVKPSRWKEPT